MREGFSVPNLVNTIINDIVLKLTRSVPVVWKPARAAAVSNLQSLLKNICETDNDLACSREMTGKVHVLAIVCHPEHQERPAETMRACRQVYDAIAKIEDGTAPNHDSDASTSSLILCAFGMLPSGRTSLDEAHAHAEAKSKTHAYLDKSTALVRDADNLLRDVHEQTM